MGVYEVVARGEAITESDAIFIKARWVITNKGDRHIVKPKARFVAQGFAYGRRSDFCSGTPALTTVKMLLSIFASTPASDDWVVTVADVSTAFIYGKIQRKVFIELPAEDRRRDGGKNVARLVRP